MTLRGKLVIGGSAVALLVAACSAPEEIWNPEEPVPGPGPGRELILDPDKVPDPAYVVLLEMGAANCDGIDAPTLAAQIETESNWNPDALNPASGAAGIAQFMPATWAAYGLDANGDGAADVFDPEDAIPSQGFYMCLLQDEVIGMEEEGILDPSQRLPHTLAGYNAGMGNVRAARGIPQNGETEHYVPKILGLRAEYALDAGGIPPMEGYDPAPVECNGIWNPPGINENLMPTSLRGLSCSHGSFGYLTTSSGWREKGSTPLSDHPLGLALDQHSLENAYDTPEGLRQNWHVAHWYQVNADRIGVKYIIFQNYRWPSYEGRHAWVPYNHGSGRGGPSLDHHNHFHISFNSQAPNPEADLISHAPREGTHPRGNWLDPADALP